MDAIPPAPNAGSANATPRWVERDGLRLRALEWGTTGPGVLLLHALTGRASSWSRVARALARDCHVVALDQRGHGESSRAPGLYGSLEFARDAAKAIDALSIGPAVVVVGHSMGAINAVALAAARPDLVRGLILEDQSVATSSRAEGRELAEWMATWPLPFPDEAAVRAYFDAAGFGPSLAPYEFASMKRTARGIEPAFDLADMAEIASEWDTRNYWDELERVNCPVLVLRGANGMYPREEHEDMARRAKQGDLVEIEGAQHFVHADQPDAYVRACGSFIARLPTASLAR